MSRYSKPLTPERLFIWTLTVVNCCLALAFAIAMIKVALTPIGGSH